MSGVALRKFEVIMNGENYLLEVDGELKKMGFYVTRYVEAVDPDEAERLARSSINKSERLVSLIHNDWRVDWDMHQLKAKRGRGLSVFWRFPGPSLIDKAKQPGGFMESGRFGHLRSVISRLRCKRIHEDRVPDVLSPVTEGSRRGRYVG